MLFYENRFFESYKKNTILVCKSTGETFIFNPGSPNEQVGTPEIQPRGEGGGVGGHVFSARDLLV